jgi:hypothetical protein
MAKGLKIGIGIGAGLLLAGGVRYAITRNRLINNLVYRPEIDFQKSSLQASKLILSVKLYINNPTPNSLKITKPTVTLRYPRPERVQGQNEDILFTSIASGEEIDINANGQTTIEDIRIEIIYTDTASVGYNIIEKLIKCEKVEFDVDVALSVKDILFIPIFVPAKSVKKFIIERKDLPNVINKWLPSCTGGSTLVTGNKAIDDFLNMVNSIGAPLSQEAQTYQFNSNFIADPNNFKAGSGIDTKTLKENIDLKKDFAKADNSQTQLELAQKNAYITSQVTSTNPVNDLALAQQIQNYEYDWSNVPKFGLGKVSKLRRRGW